MNIQQVLPEKRTRNRPKKYNEALGQKITSLICDGKMLSEICEKPGMPSPTTVRQWVVQNPDFGKQFEAARSMQADCLFEEAVAIGKDTQSSGKDRLRVETLLKAAAILKPKAYGDKKELSNVVGVVIHTTLDVPKVAVSSNEPYVYVTGTAADKLPSPHEVIVTSETPN